MSEIGLTREFLEVLREFRHPPKPGQLNLFEG